MLRAALLSVALATSPAWADDLPYVPSPNGFVESSTLVPALKDQAMLGHPKSNKLVGVYLLPDEISAIMHGGEERMSIFCRAYVIYEGETEDAAKGFLKMMIENAKKDQSKPLDFNEPDTHRIIQHFVDAAKQHDGNEVGYTGVSNLGSSIDTADAFEASMVIAGTAKTAEGTISIPMTASVAWVRHGKQILEMSDLARFEGADSISLATGVVGLWVKAFQTYQ